MKKSAVVLLMALLALAGCGLLPESTPAADLETPVVEEAPLREAATDEPAVEAIVEPTAEPAAEPAAEPTVETIVDTTAEPAAEPAAEAPAEISAIPFNLGQTVLAQTGEMDESRREMPIQLNGLIALPPEGDNLPLAIVMHGSHNSGCPSDGYTVEWPCFDEEAPNYAGFGYLLEDLARRGYAAVSLNVNAPYVFAYGEPDDAMRFPILFDMYMERIAAANRGEEAGFGTDLTGRLNLEEIVALGHSASGEHVVRQADARAANSAAEAIAAAQGPFSAVFLLAAGANSYVGMQMDLPVAVLLAECDRDLAGQPGQNYYEIARTSANRADPAVSILLQRANHNGFNSVLPPEALGSTSSICDEEGLLTPQEQQQFLTGLVGPFFDWALGRADVDLAGLAMDATLPAPDTILDQHVLTSLSLPTEQRLIPALDGGGTEGSVVAHTCDAGFAQDRDDVESCRRLILAQPGLPMELALSWSGAEGRYEVNLPEGSQDLSGYAVLHLRAAVDPMSNLNVPGEAQAFSLRLTDGAGSSTAISLAGEPALEFPRGAVWDTGSDLQWDSNLLLSSIRRPLAEFEGVDLSDVRTAELVFDQSDSGSIFVTDLEFLRGE